ncbi:MAG: hypothetical protein V3V49_14950 [Candidatus Krumholzibacteria bacterium]
MGAGDIRSRLSEAASTALAPVTPDYFPEELRQDFEWIMQKLTKHKPVRAIISNKLILGSIEMSTRAIKNKTGVKIAHRLVSLTERLKQIVDEANADL